MFEKYKLVCFFHFNFDKVIVLYYKLNRKSEVKYVRFNEVLSRKT